MERCWAERYCKGYPDRCEDLCIGYLQLKNIYRLSRMPRKYQHFIPLECDDCDHDAFIFLRDFMTDVYDHVQQGHGLFIFSGTKGNGKTTWACKIMNEYFKKVALNNNLRCRGLFINVLEFLEALKRSFNNPSEEMHELQDEIKSADLVIWDDIGAQTDSNWVRQKLYEFVNYRYSNDKAQIFTSNESLAALADSGRLEDRIVNRIKGQCKIVEFAGESRREASW